MSEKALIKYKYFRLQLPRLLQYPGYAAAVLLLVLAQIFAPVMAANEEQESIAIFFQGNNKDQEKLLDALEVQLKIKMPGKSLVLIDLSHLSKRELEAALPENMACALGVGYAPTLKMMSLRQPVSHFSVLVSRTLLDKIHRVYSELDLFVSGIYQEQPFFRQVFLARAMTSDISQVGMLLDQSDKYYLPEFRLQAAASALDLKYKILGPTDAPDKFLHTVAEEGDFLLIQNNSQLFMQSKLAALVLSAYYQQVKLIGSSLEDSKIGTLASVYTSPTTLAIETGSELTRLCHDKIQSPPRYARSFSVRVNPQIAENMQMGPFNNNQLSKQVAQFEQEFEQQYEQQKVMP